MWCHARHNFRDLMLQIEIMLESFKLVLDLEKGIVEDILTAHSKTVQFDLNLFASSLWWKETVMGPDLVPSKKK